MTVQKGSATGTRHRIWAAALAVAAYFTLFTGLSPLGFDRFDTAQPLVSCLCVGIFAALCLLFDAFLKAPPLRDRVLLRWLSGVIALMLLLNRSFLKTQGWGLLFGSWGLFAAALMMWLFLSFILLCALSLLARRLTAYLAAPRDTPLEASPRSDIIAILKMAALMLLCWIPHIIMQFPGHIETTAGQQILQAYGFLPYTKENPVFHTLILKLLLQGSQKLGLSDTMAVFVVSLSQCIPLAIGLAWSVRLTQRFAPRRGLATTLKWFYCFCPLFPLFGVFIVKDVPFAIAMLYFTCVLFVMLRDGDAFFRSKWKLAAYFVCGATLCLLRNMAVILFLLSSVFVLIRWRKSKRNMARLCAVSAAAVAVFLAFNAVVYPYLNVGVLPERQAENRSLQCQAVARVAKEHGDELTAEEIAVIDAVLPYENLAANYDPELSDPVKDTWRIGVTDEQRAAFDTLSARLAIRYPATAAQAALAIMLPYLTPGDTGRFRAVFIYGFSNIFDAVSVFDPDHLFSLAIADAPNLYIHHEPLLNFLCICGTYTWLMLAGLFLLLRRKKYRFAICYCAPLCVLVGCFLSPVAGYIRYALPYMMCTPFLTMLVLSEVAQTELPTLSE